MQVNALRAKLAAEAAAAAATAATDLAAKQQAVAVARAAMAAVVAAAAGLEATDSASHDRLLHAQQLNSLNCISLGYWPSTVSMSAVESRSLKQQQQAAAAAVVAAVRQEIQEGRQSVLRQLAGAKAQLQMQGRIEIQVWGICAGSAAVDGSTSSLFGYASGSHGASSFPIIWPQRLAILVMRVNKMGFHHSMPCYCHTAGSAAASPAARVPAASSS